MVTRAIILLLFILSCPAPGQPDSAPPLDSLVARALRHNPRLASLRTAVRGAETRIAQSAAWPDPQAAFTFYNAPASSLNPALADEYDYSIQQMVPFPGKTRRAGDVARAGVTSAQGSVFIRERAVIAEVKKAYAMLHAAQQQLAVNNQNRSLLEGMIRSLETSYQVGQAQQADVLKLRIEMSKLLNDSTGFAQQESSEGAMLNALCGDSAQKPIGRIRELPIKPVGLVVEEIVRRAGMENRELMKMKYDIETMRAEKSMLERERLPDFMIGGMYKQMRDMPNRWDLMIGITLPIAPWASGKYSGRIEETDLKIRQMEQEYEDMRAMISAGVYRAAGRARARWEEIERYRGEIIPQAGQAMRSLLMQFQTKKTDLLPLLDAYRMQKMYQMEYWMAVAEYLADRAEIEKEIGGELE